MLYLGHPFALDALDLEAQAHAIAWHYAHAYGGGKPSKPASTGNAIVDDFLADLDRL